MNTFPLPAYILTCINALETAGFEAFVAGGAVRDHLLGRPVHDYDLATSARPEQMLEIFRSYHTDTTGLKHGTLRVIVDHHPVEITAYRCEDTYEDHRRPDHVRFSTSLHEDCARRDLTINAMAYSPHTGIVDDYGGIHDLEHRIIRTVGDPVQRFSEDALRILRTVRFAAELGFDTDPDTRKAVLSKCGDLHYIAPERIREEFYRILASAGCADSFRTYFPVYLTFLPVLSVYTDTMIEETARKLEESPSVPLLRAALILAPAGKEKAVNALSALRPAAADLRQIKEYYDASAHPLQTLYDARCLCARYTVDPDRLLAYRSLQCGTDTAEFLDMCRKIRERGDCITLKQLAVTGSDITALGIRGQQIGITLHTLLDEVMRDLLPNDKDALLTRAEQLQKQTH